MLRYFSLGFTHRKTKGTSAIAQRAILCYLKTVIQLDYWQQVKVGRKKLDRDVLQARVSSDTASKLKQIAYTLDYTYNNEGSVGQLLDAIANGEIILVCSKKAPRSC